MWQTPQYSAARELGGAEWFAAPPLRGAAALAPTRIQGRAQELYKRTTRDEKGNLSQSVPGRITSIVHLTVYRELSLESEPHSGLSKERAGSRASYRSEPLLAFSWE